MCEGGGRYLEDLYSSSPHLLALCIVKFFMFNYLTKQNYFLHLG